MKQAKGDVINFKAHQHFREHLDNQARKKGMKLGTYIKAVLKKYTKYKEPELV